MMRYIVVWNPAAEDQLTEIWLLSDEQQEISRAVHRIDHLLGQDPLNVGESRGGIERILIDAYFSVLYEVREDDRLVEVIRQRRITRRR